MQPELVSPRLCLRPYTLADAADVQRLAGERCVAAPTAALPHPYPDGAAEAWIAPQAEHYAAGREVSYAVTLGGTGELVGTVSLLGIDPEQACAEVGYWIGLAHWGQGYATEALARLLVFAEPHFQLSRFVGRCLASNPGSARTMEKNGFVCEGRLRQHQWHDGRFEDMLLYGRCAPGRL